MAWYVWAIIGVIILVGISVFIYALAKAAGDADERLNQK